MDRELFETIVKSFQDMINNGISIEVTVRNVPNFGTQKQISEVIADLEDVVSVHKRSYGEGNLNVSVKYKGNTDSFGEAVDGQLIGDKILSVSEVSGGRVVIDLR